MTTTTFQNLYSQLNIRIRLDRMRSPIRYNLSAQMRAAHVTIAELAAAMRVTQKRVRQVRSMDRVEYLVALDYQEAIEKIAAVRVFEAAIERLPASWRKHAWATPANFADAVRLAGRAS